MITMLLLLLLNLLLLFLLFLIFFPRRLSIEILLAFAVASPLAQTYRR